MKCTYCETEYGMSHTPYQCSANLVKQRDEAREQVRAENTKYLEMSSKYYLERSRNMPLREALRDVLGMCDCIETDFGQGAIKKRAYEVLTATEAKGGE